MQATWNDISHLRYFSPPKCAGDSLKLPQKPDSFQIQDSDISTVGEDDDMLYEKTLISELKVPPININSFEKNNKIGEGGYCNVYKIKDKSNNLFYAAKISKYSMETFSIKNKKRSYNDLSL